MSDDEDKTIRLRTTFLAFTTTGNSSSVWPSEPETRRQWLTAIDYEVEMYFATREMSKEPCERHRRNTITVSEVIHTRNLCNLCISTKDNDVKLVDILGEDPETSGNYPALAKLISDLRDAYGRFDKDVGTPRWSFNKRVAHITKDRAPNAADYDHRPELDAVRPILNKIISQIEAVIEHPFSRP